MSSTRLARKTARRIYHPTYINQVILVLAAIDAMTADEREQTLTLMALTVERHTIANWTITATKRGPDKEDVRILGEAVS